MLITGQGGLPYKSDGDDRRKSKIKPLRETILKAPGVTIFFFFIHGPKRYLNGQIQWLSVSNTPSVTKICNLRVHSQARRRASLSLLHGTWDSPKVYTDLHHSQCCHFSFLSCLIVKILVKEIFSRQCFIGFMGSSLDLGHIFENTSITYF